MLHCVGLVISDVSEERSASIIRVTRIGELGMLAITSNQRTLRSRKHFTRLWSPLTAAPTRSSRGDRRWWNSLCAASPSPCQPTGSSRATYWTRPTGRTHLPTATQPVWFHHRHRHLRRLHAPVATSASPCASTPKQTSPRGRGWCGNLPQSARSQVEAWLPSNQAVTQQWTGYLATKK
jgi:hypothetical protein